MIVLDSNVVSALMSDDPGNRAAVVWADAKPVSVFAITVITLFEVERGIERIPEGRRRGQLKIALRRVLSTGLGDRILPFDERAALEAARLEGRRKRTGLVVGVADAMIAGIVVARGAAIATRNIKHFADCGVEVHDPWAG